MRSLTTARDTFYVCLEKESNKKPTEIASVGLLYPVDCKKSGAPQEHVKCISLHGDLLQSCNTSYTAVVLLGEEELHLVAMPSKEKKFPCFWCYAVPSGLYTACLGMLNLRCLAIVFDLDETLIVANTMKSFEDRIEALSSWIEREADSIRVSGMTAELKRYVDDRALLKQFIETDCVVDNGKMFKVQLEEVPLLSDSHEPVVRPVIRLPERNTVLTRVNPEIRDTSVLVRLRPAWEDLRSYLTAKGRKRFEVYVCTMAERDYALEMWRLLDPEAHLISSKQLLDRVVCVKSGKHYILRVCHASARKSLLNVFQDGNCHPKMAMVIDDRLKVWEDKDQPRVHVVPAFTPYYAPQAETANAVPVLCVARNVACNVRGCFFKEYDENLLRRICELFYEDEVSNLPSPPDVSNYLMSEDASFVPNGNNAPIAEGMIGPEVAPRLSQLDEKYGADSATHPATNSPEPRPEIPHVASVPNVFGPTSFRAVIPSDKPSLLGAPFRRDSSSSEFDEVKRRFFIVNPSQDLRCQGSSEPPLLSRSPASPIEPQGGWLVEEDMNRVQLNNRKSGTVQESGALKTDKHRARQNVRFHGTLGSASVRLPSQVSEVRGEEGYPDREQQRHNPSAIPLSGPSLLMPYIPPTPKPLVCKQLCNEKANALAILPLQSFVSCNASCEKMLGGICKTELHSGTCKSALSTMSEIGVSENSLSNGREFQTDGGRVNFVPSLSVGVLQEIGRRCSSKVEFRSVITTSKDFQFSFEVLFTGEKIGAGMGRTRKDAQQQAAENALRCLAAKFVRGICPVEWCYGAMCVVGSVDFLRYFMVCWTTKETKSEERSTGGAGNPLGFGVSRLQIGPDWISLRSSWVAGGPIDHVLLIFARVEIPWMVSRAEKYISYVAPRSGAVDREFDQLTRGFENGFIWDTINPGSDELPVEDGLSKESTSEVAEGALGNASNGGNQLVRKRSNSPRSSVSIPSKRLKEELMQGSQGLSSSRQPKNEHAVES
ncbi:hypothetical protein RHSIM_Rhsim04G0128900 [Rhododendron simsii]|uniref:protein-serine/threonine phosphatase n=1 Tax=Rhododendron simsii TaxID=118357 RepID=A0A834H023_RHOSS|nr:hypothetical protein RHSIM_Rhsim04G0128900 [Rhododendron simsii]